MKHQKYQIDMNGWTLDAINDFVFGLEAKLLKAAGEALRLSLEDDNTYAYFPVEWNFVKDDGIGGPPVQDAATMYLRFGLEGEDQEEKPTFSFSLRDCVTDFLDGISEKGMTGSEHVHDAKRLRDALQELADQISATLPK